MAKKPATTSDTNVVTSATTETDAPARTESKKDRLISMLRRDGGTTIAEISASLVTARLAPQLLRRPRPER